MNIAKVLQQVGHTRKRAQSEKGGTKLNNVPTYEFIFTKDLNDYDKGSEKQSIGLLSPIYSTTMFIGKDLLDN